MSRLLLLVGIFVIASSTTTFSQTNSWMGTLNALYLQDMAIAPSGEIYVVSYTNGVWRSDNAGDDWNTLTFPVSNLTAVAATSRSSVYIGTWGQGVYRSTDRGNTWATSGPPTLRVTAIATTPGGDIFVSTFGDSALYRSTDDGRTWFPKTRGIAFRTDPIHLDAVIAGPAGLVYAAADQVYRSSNSGEDWSLIGPPSSENLISLLLTSSGHLFVGGLGGVCRTTDEGATWKSVNSGSPTNFVRSLVVNSKGRIYRGTDGGGVYYSDDEGDNWQDFNSGLTDRSVYVVAADPGGYLFAATYNAGVFRTRYSTTSVKDPETAFPRAVTLLQNYPNPFNPSTTIQFTIVSSRLPLKAPNGGQGQLTVLSVYDILGREVMMLVNEVKDPGSYTVQFDASGLTSGVYVCGLQVGGQSLTRKLLLLR